MLSFDYNDFNENKTKTDPNGLNNLATHGAYGDSALYGYTEEVQENQDTTGAYYPIIKTEKIYLGKESAEMCKKTGKETVAVEFKIALDEFTKAIKDDNNNIIGYEGFEYYVEAGYQDYDLFYPIVYAEPVSERCYRPNYYPAWEWDSKNAAKITTEDMQSGAMRMRNNCMPVVTLGAKICENYLCPDNNQYEPAIRFGALYTEDYLRNWREKDAHEVKEDDPGFSYEDMHTADINDYWDIHEVGIAVLPTQMLENEGEVLDLTLETPAIFTAPADNIVNWQCGENVGGWSNFADYENFVYYITLWGLSEDMKDVKFSFVPYVDFYASAGTETYYGETFVRSYNMIKDYTLSEDGFEDDNSTPVLPDSDYSDYPPAENHPQESSVVIEDNSESNE